MLLVIDYMLGGNHYQMKDDIFTHVGHHVIFVKFDFSGEQYCFARKTAESDTVYKSSLDYQILEEEKMTLSQYCIFLQEKFSLDAYSCTLRTFIGLFARIYDRGNYYETLPLQEHHSESRESSVKRLVKMFGLYKQIEELDLNVKSLKERNTIFKKALAIDLIKGAKTKKQQKETIEQIKALQQDIDVLTIELSTMEVPLDTVQLQKVLGIKEELAKLQAIKAKVESQIKQIQRSLDSTRKENVVDLGKLKRFFPNVNLLEISQINHFHESLCVALADEMKSKIGELSAYKEELEINERNILLSVKEVMTEPNPAKIGVQQLAAKEKKMMELIAANSAYEKKTSFLKECKDAEKLYINAYQKILTGIQQQINAIILNFNDFVYANAKKAPQLTLLPKNYIYDCPDDEGTGSRFSGLILFDLAVLKCTSLPVLFHDSLILKNIEDKAIEKIMQLYESFTNKQIFIAFDKKTAYTDKTKEIVNKNKILELVPNGYELFGKQWSRLDGQS